MTEPIERGRVEPTTWGEVGIGSIVRDKRDRFHTVVDEKAGWLQLSAVRTGEITAVRRPAPDVPVDIYVPSEDEALRLLHAELGAFFLRDIEDREHTVARTLRWRMDPMPPNATLLRDHLDMIHQINVNDVLRRHVKALEDRKAGKTKEAKKEAALRAEAAISELFAAHDEAHSDPQLWPMAFPHYHQKEN